MKRKSEHEETGATRQERRERKLRKKRETMQQHGKGLARVYRDAMLKKLKQKSEK